VIKQILILTGFLVVIAYLVNQLRKPSRWVGRLFLWVMNSRHSDLTDWGLAHVPIEHHYHILDVGCGGGRTIQKLSARAVAGKVYGVDYAKGSVAVSRRKNAESISAGRVEIYQASVSQLPFPDDQFDLVTAVESQYYWPDPVNDMREILRVLKPGGTLVVIAESYLGSRYTFLQWPVMWLLRSTQLSFEGYRQLFEAAGFTEIQLFEDRRRGWISAIGKRPLIGVLT
jgi:SAM-dependent methyltransferase